MAALEIQKISKPEVIEMRNNERIFETIEKVILSL